MIFVDIFACISPETINFSETSRMGCGSRKSDLCSLRLIAPETLTAKSLLCLVFYASCWSLIWVISTKFGVNMWVWKFGFIVIHHCKVSINWLFSNCLVYCTDNSCSCMDNSFLSDHIYFVWWKTCQGVPVRFWRWCAILKLLIQDAIIFL